MARTGADIRLPPPLLFLATVLVGWLVDRVVPLPLPGLPAPLGWLVVLAGVALMTWAVRIMVRARTTFVPWEQVDHLVVAGPFRLSRNPIYLADVLIVSGLAVVLGTLWPIVLLPVTLTVLHRHVISREEAYLGTVFGQEYADYRATVRRWI